VEKSKFKFEFVYLAPILVSLIFGLGCAYLVLGPKQSSAVVLPITPFTGTTPDVPIGNAIYFVVLIAVAATLFYFLLKRNNKLIIKALVMVSMTTAALLLSWFYVTAILGYCPTLAYQDYLLVSSMIIIAVLFDLAVFKFGGAVRNAAVICLGGALGIFLGFEMLQFAGLPTVVVVLAFLAVYDIIAVYKGPVGKIAESGGGLEQLQGLSYAFKDIQMGLGDLVFYSLLMGAMFFAFQSSVLPYVMSIAGIMAGSILTLFMLQKRGIFPGLPFPVLLGLAGGLITGFLL
jgi:presenilin-like A22 family membrane protease